MKILFLLCGNVSKASSRVRGYWVAEELSKTGFKCALYSDNSRLALAVRFFQLILTDAVIFQKTYSRYHLWLAKFAKAIGKRVYLDIDDAPSRINSPVTLKNFESLAQTANGVFAGSAALHNYVTGLGAKAHLVPTGVKLENYQVVNSDRCSDKVCLGWIGNGSHYEKDLVELLKYPLTKLANVHQVRLKFVGSQDCEALRQEFGNIDGLSVEFVDRVDWSDPRAVMREISEFDIGLYPLLETDFNKYKCGFKALEYMAAGLPVVASENPANRDIITDGQEGYFASDEDEWCARLELLISNSDIRIDMGKAGRRRVEKSYDIKIIAQKIRKILRKRDFLKT